MNLAFGRDTEVSSLVHVCGVLHSSGAHLPPQLPPASHPCQRAIPSHLLSQQNLVNPIPDTNVKQFWSKS